MLWGLFVVLGIILIIYGLLRKRLSFIQSNDKSKIKIIEVRHIMQKKAVCLVEVKGQEFLIGLGNDTITLLSKIQNSDESSFNTTLDSATKQHEQKSL